MANSKQIWVDLDNTPHVPFFLPIIRELEARGYEICLTARDCFQVCGLADLHGLTYVRVGRHYGKHRLMKVLGTIFRTVQLLPTVWREKPLLAVSHGSRSQLLAAKCGGIPSLVIVDYEFAKPVPGFCPTWVMAPEIIPDSVIRFGGEKVFKYPGIKEDVYVPGFRRDPSMRRRLGLREDAVVATIRPPATEAHYHNPESDKLFDAVMKMISQTKGLQAVLLPRNERQGAAIRRSWSTLFTEGRVLIPDHALDGLNLIWHSDLVISGGGTMNREAAALGIPVYSIFRGRIGAVDRYLADHGRLVLLESVEDVQTKLVFRHRSERATTEIAEKAALSVIVDHIIETIGGTPALSSTTEVSSCFRAVERGQ